jgi:hypothetical protein
VTWLVWRQGRAENVLLAALLGALAVLLLLTGAHMHSALHASGLSVCTSDAQTLPTTCRLGVNNFVQRFDGLNQLGPWLGLTPGLIGVLMAAPLVLELDQGTYRLHGHRASRHAGGSRPACHCCCLAWSSAGRP